MMATMLDVLDRVKQDIDAEVEPPAAVAKNDDSDETRPHKRPRTEDEDGRDSEKGRRGGGGRGRWGRGMSSNTRRTGGKDADHSNGHVNQVGFFLVVFASRLKHFC